MNDLELRSPFNKFPPVLVLFFLCTFGFFFHLLLGMWDGFKFWKREVRTLFTIIRIGE